MFWYLFYFIYVFSTLRFTLHSAILFIPLRKQKFKKSNKINKTVIQYPICNEPNELILRFINSLNSIPNQYKSQFLLQICDDSKNSKFGYISSLNIPIRWVYSSRWENPSLIPLVKNKAANMNAGLQFIGDEYKYIAIFDADHIVDGLGMVEAIKILLKNEKIACIQSRWVPILRQNTTLSLIQEQITHLHIEREQIFKSIYNLWPIFNGAGAVWNRSIMQREIGQWVEQNTCEDTDISGLIQSRGYLIKVLPTWTTRIDLVYSWSEYLKQQLRWSAGNSIQLQRHTRDPKGWGLKKLYWLSWNIGHFLSIFKYIIPIVMFYKLYKHEINWIDELSMLPHLTTWIASSLTWNNKLYFRGFITYPIHYVIELIVLPYQIYGWFDGFINWKTKNDFRPTNKMIN